MTELPSEEARRLFKRFVAKWNSGSLAAKFYAGITAQPAASRTRHQWGFADKLSDTDMLTLDRTKDSVDKQTQQSGKGQSALPAGPTPSHRVAGPMAPSARPSAGSSEAMQGNPRASGPQPGPAPALPGSRLAELQAKEQQRLDHFKRSLGL